MGQRNELINVFSGRALTVGGVTTIENDWPLGEGWNEMILRLNIVLTIGTGTGALVEALQRVLTNITLLTDVDGLIVNSPARPHFRRAQILRGGVPPIADTFSAASGTYRIEIPILFSDPRLHRPEDTILDTARYKKIALQLTLGDVNRLLSTVGTASMTATVDIDVKKWNGALNELAKPILVPYLVSRAPVNPNSQLFVNLETAGDLAYRRLMIYTSDGSDSSANSGDAFQGTSINTILNLLSIEESAGFVGLRSVIDDMIQRGNASDYLIDGGAVLPGWYIHDYVKTGNIHDAEFSGDKSDLRVTYTTDTLVATSRVHVFVDGVRNFKEL